MSIGRVLRCRKRLHQYTGEFYIRRCEALTRHDWLVLDKLHSFLGGYCKATTCAQKNERHLGEWLSTFEFIHSKTSEAVREFQVLQKGHPNCLEYSWLEGSAKSVLESVCVTIALLTVVQRTMLQKLSGLLANGAGFMSSGMVICGRGVAWTICSKTLGRRVQRSV
jgi:hypothetical protein